MQRNIEELSKKHYDVLVVGGGIFAACAAWDCVLRGLSVAIIEKQDFCSGTSANSFKMVHGGMRYLQHADIKRLRASCHERSALLRIAPHLVQPLPIIIPTYGYGKSGKVFLGAGLFLYDALTMGRNAGILDRKRHVTRTQFFSREEVLKEYPDLDPDGLTGAAMFYDGQMYNPTRLVLAFVKSAQAKGAHVANYVEATKLVRDGNKVVGVDAIDGFTRKEFRIRASVVLNAAGPWSEWLLENSFSKREKPTTKGVYSRDACFVVKRRFASPYAIAVQGRTTDPDALLARPARHLFLVPWRDYTLVGVWHVVWKRHPEEVVVKEDEIQDFIEEMNWAYPSLNLTSKEVTMWNAGLVPFGENEEGAENLSYGKRSNLIDHKKIDDLDGLVTLIGIRYTTARGDSAKAVDIVCAKLNKSEKRAATAFTPLVGGDIEDFDALVNGTFQRQDLALSEHCVRALTHNYGTQVEQVLDFAREDKVLAATLGESTVLKAEVVHAVKKEIAYTLADVVFRRTDLATGGNPGTPVLLECARIMADLLGWDEDKLQQELNAVLVRFPAWTEQGSI
ncbi:MAG: glycerol-3-phosphate dehydrogenase/oxidase [Thiohalomonadales bacterium]